MGNIDKLKIELELKDLYKYLLKIEDNVKDMDDAMYINNLNEKIYNIETKYNLNKEIIDDEVIVYFNNNMFFLINIDKEDYNKNFEIDDDTKNIYFTFYKNKGKKVITSAKYENLLECKIFTIKKDFNDLFNNSYLNNYKLN